MDAVEVLRGHLQEVVIRGHIQEVVIRGHLQEDLHIFPKLLVSPQGMFNIVLFFYM